MTTWTTQDRIQAQPRVGSHWVGQGPEQFVVQAVWCPNEEPDVWISYTGADAKVYTCRLEAFTSRFTERPQ
jgi:hypothetical protein